MESVDLASESPRESESEHSQGPLVQAFNGTPSGISPATHNSLAFTFQNSTEQEAFDFLTASLRETLGDDATDVSDETLSRYLRWKPDVKRAADRFRAYQKFQMDAFDGKPLLLSQDPRLTVMLQSGVVVAPEELVAKDGSRVVVIRGSKCDITHITGRAILYTLQSLHKNTTVDPMKGITIVLDLVGVARRNIPKNLATLLSKSAGCFPLRIRGVYAVAMPWWFPSSYTKLFSTKIRSRTHYLKNKTALAEVIENERLLEEDGGTTNFDLQQWISSTVLHEVEQLDR
jgi:hypothetical protein